MAKDLTSAVVQEGSIESVEPNCLQCGGPKLHWQILCGAACAALYEANSWTAHENTKLKIEEGESDERRER